MGKPVIDADVLYGRIEELTKEVRSLLDRRKSYGESGFRGGMMDDLLRQIEAKETLIREYKALLKAAEK